MEHLATENLTGSLRNRSREIAELDDKTAKGERAGPKRRRLDEPDSCELLFLNAAKEAEEQRLNVQDRRTTPHHKSALEPCVPVPSITAAEHDGGPPNRTLRLQSVPATLDEEKLRDYLTSLECSKGPTSTIKGFSLSKDGVSQVATVSFLDIPTALGQCQKGKAIIVPLPSEKDQTLSIDVDCDFLGMTVLYCPENPVYDIIAVGGLAGHAFGSWKSRNDPHSMWLRDCLKKHFPSSRVLTWGCDSSLLDPAGNLSIANFARQLLQDIGGVRRYVQNRPLIFICHSLGGLIAKKALVEASEEERLDAEKAVLRSCVGLLLFGVPNNGLKEETFLSMVGNLGGRHEQFVRNLSEGSELLHCYRRDFDQIYAKYLSQTGCALMSFYETKDSPVVEQTAEGRYARNPRRLIRMVSEDSATAIGTKISIATDHSNLVKFTGINDAHYLALRTRIESLVSNVPTALIFTAKEFQKTKHRFSCSSRLSDAMYQEFVTQEKIFASVLTEFFVGKECHAGVVRLLDSPNAEEWQHITERENNLLISNSSKFQQGLRDMRDHVSALGILCTSPNDPPKAQCRSKGTVNALFRLIKDLKNGNRTHYSKREAEFEKALGDIRRCNQSLSAALSTIYHGSTRMSDSRASLGRARDLPAVEESGDTRARSADRREIRVMSTTLHRALCRCATCSENEFYFHLPTIQRGAKHQAAPPPENTEQPMKFSFLISRKELSSTFMPFWPAAPTSPCMQIEITQAASQSSSPLSRTICTMGPHVFAIANEPQLDGFLISARTPGDMRLPQNNGTLKARSESWLAAGDTASALHLGLELGYAAINLHGSPWLQSWNNESITLFASSQNKQQVGLLDPHVLCEFREKDNQDFTSDLYMLGYMLLRMAGLDLKQVNSKTSQSHCSLPRLDFSFMPRLTKKFGSDYGNLVLELLKLVQKQTNNCCEATDDELDDIETLLGKLAVVAEAFPSC